MIQATTVDQVRQGVEMFGPAPGGAAMMDMEMEAAQLAIETQMYITWRPPDSIQECTRVGPRAKCFCGHLFGNHSDRFPGKCGNCVCKRFQFIPQRPEEVGEWWLPRRKEFDIRTYSVKCRCNHSHEAHHPVNIRCHQCNCMIFESNFLCVVCDKHWEEHETCWEDEMERRQGGRTYGQAFLPLSTHQDIQEMVFRGGRGQGPFVRKRPPVRGKRGIKRG